MNDHNKTFANVKPIPEVLDYERVAPTPSADMITNMMESEVIDYPEFPVNTVVEERKIVSSSSKDYSPKLTIYGCGGFGVNTIKNLPSILDYPNAHFRIIDTSEANTHQADIDPCIPITYMGKTGHGKLRETNIAVLQQKVDNLVFSEEEESDIDIVIFSLTGGTGSVVGPLIIKALSRKDKPVIIITVAESISTVDCEHSLKAIKSMENMSRDAYVNMILFDNSVNEGRTGVDKAAVEKIRLLTKAINLNNITELDKSDIVVAMRPYHHKILSGVRGLFVVRINDDCPYCYDEEPMSSCHSMILVEHASNPMIHKSTVHRTIHYSGKWIEAQRPIGISFGLPISDTFMKKYEGILKRSQAASSAKNIQSTISIPGSNEHDSGMVF